MFGSFFYEFDARLFFEQINERFSSIHYLNLFCFLLCIKLVVGAASVIPLGLILALAASGEEYNLYEGLLGNRECPMHVLTLQGLVLKV